MANDYLAHHGVKGMHWGVRRYQPYSTTGERKSGEPGKEVGKAAKKAARAERRKTRRSIRKNYTGSRSSDALKLARKQDINKMSNQELQQHITRLNLERQYRSLTKMDLTKGKNYMKTGIEYDTKTKTILGRSTDYAKKVAKGAAWASTTGGAGVVAWG